MVAKITETELIQKLRLSILNNGMPVKNTSKYFRPAIRKMLKWNEEKLKLEVAKLVLKTSSLSTRSRSFCMLLAQFMSERDAAIAAKNKRMKQEITDGKEDKPTPSEVVSPSPEE